MKKRLIAIMLLFLSIALLAACESEEDIDTLVKEYVKDKYGFEVKITNRESVTEGNTGDRKFEVIQTKTPKIQFEVYLSGGFTSKVGGDTYFQHKQGKDYGQQFMKENKEELESYDYDKVEFTPSSDSQNGFNISLVSNDDISFNTQESVDHLLAFIQLINIFDDKVLTKTNLDYLTITSKKDNELEITLHDLHTIKKIKDLNNQLEMDSYFVNKALFEKNKSEFMGMQGKLAELGYIFKNGVRMGSLTGSLLCMEDSIKDGECIGGYEAYFEGPMDAESLFKLVEFLNSQKVKFKDAFIPGGDNPVRLENLESIKTVDDVKALLK